MPPAWASNIRSARAATAAARELEVQPHFSLSISCSSFSAFTFTFSLLTITSRSQAMECPPLSKARGILARKKKIKGVTEYLLHWWPTEGSPDEVKVGPTMWISREALSCSRLCVGYVMEFERCASPDIMIDHSL